MKRHHLQMLSELVEAGHGTLDTSGGVRVGPHGHLVPGDAVAWLSLVAGGYVAGERGMMMPTERGRDEAAGYGNGRVRESR